MAYDPNVPTVTNQVRGASGDLTKMRENFTALLPILASGMNALISGGSNVSGAVAVVQGAGANAQWFVGLLPLDNLSDVNVPSPSSGQVLTFDGAEWVPGLGATALDDLTDVNAPSPSADQVLKFDGMEWVPAADAGGSTLLDAFAIIRMTSGGTLSVASGTYATILSGSTASGVVATGGFVINETSGTVTVPTGSGITHVRLHGQATWDAAAGANGHHDLRVRIDGAAPTYVEPETSIRETANEIFTQHLVTPLLEVSGGEVLTLEARHNDSGSRNVLGGGDPSNGRRTFFAVQGYTTSGGGGSGQGGTLWLCQATLASGATESVPNNTLYEVSGLVERKNVGGFTVTGSGTIIVPSDITHVQIQAQCTWEDSVPASDTSWRELSVIRVGGSPDIRLDSNSGTVAIRNRLRAVRNAANVVQSPVFAVSGGEEYRLQAWHTDGSALDLLGGTNANGGLTSLSIQGFNLVDAT